MNRPPRRARRAKVLAVFNMGKGGLLVRSEPPA